MKKAFLKKDFLYNIFGAPGRTRTLLNGSEDHCVIHYTTGAYFSQSQYKLFSPLCKAFYISLIYFYALRTQELSGILKLFTLLTHKKSHLTCNYLIFANKYAIF